ncbi:type III restriction endonuclease subunit R [Serratia sp. PAMC26656]|uniref:type III restriction endonuclease subunit R n=1 Tax=Serratia sp. PAMC26656 TaxID=2775909 RepID=UPI0018F692C3|nr:type III restriction endonuclease subunit R [Serratia sp. PAMC26656]MBJ7893976.1 type III restriction endonuclease subunit R [Serratia sp. PAMC26656]
MHNNIYKFIKAECGSGKTYQLQNLINSTEEKYLIVQGKIDLLNQTFSGINNGHLITSQTHTSNVDSSINEFLLKGMGRVLGITAKSFFKIDPILLVGYRIYLDDVVNFHAFKTINEKNRKIKAILQDDIFTDFDELSDKYCLTSKKDATGDIVTMISKGFEMVDTHDHFALNSEYFKKNTTVVDNVTISTYDDDIQQLTMLAWIDIEKYHDCDLTFMANKFDETLLYKSKPDMFVESTFDGLRKRSVPVTRRLNVKYFSKSKVLSKSFRMAYREYFERVIHYITNELKGQDYYYTRNNSESFTMNGHYVPVDTRGMNGLQGYSTCVWMASCRPSPVEASMTELFFKIDGQALVRSREYESLEQFVQRGCLRDFESTETMTVYVFDEQQALSLGGEIEYIDLGIDDMAVGVNGRPTGEIPRTLQKAFSKWQGRNANSTELIASYKKWKVKQQEKNPDVDFSTLDERVLKNK